MFIKKEGFKEANESNPSPSEPILEIQQMKDTLLKIEERFPNIDTKFTNIDTKFTNINNKTSKLEERLLNIEKDISDFANG